MAKFYGNVGFFDTVEVDPGVWEEQITVRSYYGDLVKNTSRYSSSNGVNDDLNISNSISIVADPYANSNFQKIKYIEFMGSKWKVNNVEIQYPRLVLTTGGLYHE